jgi:hypothetical protein
MPIQTPGTLSLKEAIYTAFLEPLQEDLKKIENDEVKKETEAKAIANIEKISKKLAIAIDEHILNTIVIIKAGIPVSIKTEKTTGKGKTVGNLSNGANLDVNVDVVQPAKGRGETTDVGTS